MTDVAPYVKRLLDLSEYQLCADCQKPHPTWASTTFGVFICINCSGIHRNLGTHITLVRSVTLDTWSTQQYKVMKKVGNKRANDYYEAKLIGTNGRPSSTDRQSMEKFIYDKYVLKLFAADGPPPHISFLMPDSNHRVDITHRNRKIHSVVISNHNPLFPQNENGIQNFTKSELSNDTDKSLNSFPLSLSTNHNESHTDSSSHLNKNSHCNIQSKFARPINSNPNEQPTKKISSFDLSTFSKLLNSEHKINADFDDNNDTIKNIDQNQEKSINNSDHCSFHFEKNPDLTRENQKNNIHDLLNAVGIKPTMQEDNSSEQNINYDKAFFYDLKQSSNSLNNSTNPMLLSSNQQNQNSYFSKSRISSFPPKFAKQTKSEQIEESMQENETKKQKTISEMKKSQKSSIKSLLEVVGIQNDSESSSKSENNTDDIIDFSFENEDEGEMSIKIENENSIASRAPESTDNKKVLPKFAKIKENNNDHDQNLSDKVNLFENNTSPTSQSNEVFKVLNHIQDKKETSIYPNKQYDNKLNVKTNEIESSNQDSISYNSGVPQQTDDNSNAEENRDAKKHKILPKFALRKDETENRENDFGTNSSGTNPIFELLNKKKGNTESLNRLKENKKNKISQHPERIKEIIPDEDILFINPGVEDQLEDDGNKSSQNTEFENNEPLERTKSLPKFAKRIGEGVDIEKSEESLEAHLLDLSRHSSYSSSQNNNLFKLLNNIKEKKEPVKVLNDLQNKRISKKAKKEINNEEELIFYNPGVEDQTTPEIITETDASSQIREKEEVESNKPLPKFAKKNNDNEDQSEDSQTPFKNDYIFSALNQMDKKHEEPVILKDIQKTDQHKKTEKNKEDKLIEEIIFINPGVDQSNEENIQIGWNYNSNVNNGLNNCQEEINTKEIVMKKEKSLPKFAKRKEENEVDNTLPEINNKIEANQNDHNVLLFEVLNHLK